MNDFNACFNSFIIEYFYLFLTIFFILFYLFSFYGIALNAYAESDF